MSNGLNPEAQQERQDHLPRAVPGPERRHAGEGVRPRADARRFKTETEHAQDHGAWSDPRAGKTTLRSYGDAHLAAQTFDETTREAVALRLRLHVYPQLGDYALAALRHSVVQAWARGLQQQLAPSYVRVVFANLSAILQAAVDDGAIGRNPRRAASVKPPAPDRRKVLPWSAERVAAVAAALPGRDRAIIAVAAGLGLRQGECFGLPESVALRLAAHLEAWPAVAVTLPWREPAGGATTMTVIPATRLARPRRWPGVVAWALWALAMLGLAAVPWLDRLSRQAGRPDLAQLTPDIALAPVLGHLSAATVGAVLASRRPRHPVGWLLLGLALSLTAAGVIPAYAYHGLLARPGALPAAGAVARYYPATAPPALALLSLVLLLTPTGSLPSPRWRWWAWVTGATPAVLLLVVPLAPGRFELQLMVGTSPFNDHALGGVLLVANQLALAITTLALVIAAGSLVVRFRRARGTERQQLRWVVLAAALIALAALVVLAALALGSPILLDWAAAVCVAVLPVAVGAAILRYRLYDLDRIISRTLAWGLLTVLLGGGYAAVILGLGQLLGRDSSLAVAAATLAAAALFHPVRRRVQAGVDRRFNRRRHDAGQKIAAFSDHLREQVDLDTLTAELLGVAEQTMQPTQAWLWLGPSYPASSPAGGPTAHPSRSRPDPTAG